MVDSPSTTVIVPSACSPDDLRAFLDTVLTHAPSGNPAWTAAYNIKQSMAYAAPEILSNFWMKVYSTVLLPHVAPHDTENWTFAIHEHWSGLMLMGFKGDNNDDVDI
jgi:hypothetical protein